MKLDLIWEQIILPLINFDRNGVTVERTIVSTGNDSTLMQVLNFSHSHCL